MGKSRTKRGWANMVAVEKLSPLAPPLGAKYCGCSGRYSEIAFRTTATFTGFITVSSERQSS